ncbi:hypothetical protein EYZ11_010275 [Aspergillus tanneri]|uniref:Uncharacterized protein n=1 Tax=Aspergillus tanneri TaxID=1220188 RepID=A0A4S3J7X2_9EURO|nr:hypothetical protein EYZ11_010275 [Aspergillus tanneri]
MMWVYDFLEDVIKNPKKYNVHPDSVPELRKILRALLRLSLGRTKSKQDDGKDFRNKSLEPDQHIYRARNDKAQKKEDSKFNLMRHTYNGVGYWCPYDLLGLFLASMGPAPFGATKRSFYLPLTAVYGRWCSAIAGPPRGVGEHPCIFQCTWARRINQQDRFFLGASLGGYNFNPEQTGTWEKEMKMGRFNLVKKNLMIDWGFETSPSREQNGLVGTRFGNCGETYPFIAIKNRNMTINKGAIYGKTYGILAQIAPIL